MSSFDVENPVVIDSLWRGNADYRFVDVQLIEFTIDIEVAGKTTTDYAILDDQLFEIVARDNDNIISDNEAELEAIDDPDYPDLLTYTENAVLRIHGQVREKDFDDVEAVIYDNGFDYNVVEHGRITL